MSFVLDSSVALAWLLPDEANDRTDALADRLDHQNAHVPSTWSLEVSNALLAAMRRKRLTEAEFDRCIAALSALPIEVDAPAALAPGVALARRFGLTTYDAAYLELAQRRGFALATLDEKLRASCKTLKVAVLP
jgi:predicted nucleic acid-binding protein